MPIYEYECEKCRCGFETLIRSRLDEDSVTCPKCGGGVKRVQSCFSTKGVRAGASGLACAPSNPGGFS